MDPLLPEDPFSTEWTREALRSVVGRGIGHITLVSLFSYHILLASDTYIYIRASRYGTRTVIGSWTIFQVYCWTRGGY